MGKDASVSQKKDQKWPINLKRCITWLVIRKEAHKYHFLATKLAATKKCENTNNWRNYDSRVFFICCCWRVRQYYHFGKQYYVVKLTTITSCRQRFMFRETPVWVCTPRKPTRTVATALFIIKRRKKAK